jgi:glycerol-3-phosphate dehydrogenase
VAGGKYTTYRSMSEEAADLACEAIAPGLRKIHETAERALPDTNLPADPVGLAREAVRREWVQRLPDLLQVSTYLGYEQKWTWESLLPWASALGQELGWDRQRTEMEADTILASRK